MPLNGFYEIQQNSFWILKSKLNMKIYILFWIFIGVECRRVKTDANARRCKVIESFYGGYVEYSGERKQGSSVFYGCNDGYHLSPNNVESSTCSDDFQWNPVPPHCLKMAKVEIPRNGHIKENKDILLHDESYRLTCHDGYELYSENSGYIERRVVQITNKNGTLEPKVPKCEEKRCDPADQHKAIVKYKNGSSVTSKIPSQTKVKLECEKGYDFYRGDQPMKTPLSRRCVRGNIESAPVCKEAKCLVSGFPGNRDTYHREYQTPYFLPEGDYIGAKNKLEIVCTNEDDFELFVNSTASYLESFTTKCRKGRFDVETDEFPICIEKRCHIKPSQGECYTTNEKEECIRDEFNVPSRTKVTLTCREGYKLNRSEDGLSKHENDEVQITCTKGSYFQGYKCIQDYSCKLKIYEGSKYYLNRTIIEDDGRIPHNADVDLQCLDDFDIFDEDDNFVNDTEINPHLTCYQGAWKNMYKCKKRCNAFNVSNGEIIIKGENTTADLAFVHRYSITVRCRGSQYNDFQMKCDNGEWRGSVNCNDERKKINVDDVSENTTPDMAGTADIVEATIMKRCSLPSDQRFIYRDQNERRISEESFIESGETVTVSCATFDYFDFLTYDHDDDSITEPTVTCIDGELSSLELDCPAEPASCLELENGVVKKSFNLYIVSCDEGFSLNFMIPEMSECTCKNGELRSTIGNQIPKCIQKNCVLPYDADDNLSVKDRSRVLSLSAGSIIVSGDHVYLNCSKVTEGIYEPLNRRFKCMKGRWLEDEKDPHWVFGNDGEFPKCRKAICEPYCTNGGVCYKDDNCRCKHLTSGKRCEIIWCDEQCSQNGGRCATPGECSCPEEKYGPYCEKKFCELPEDSAKPKKAKIKYSMGETLTELECGIGYILSSMDSMICQEDGSWSNIIKCVKNQCSVPEIENAVLDRKSEKEYKHLDKIRLWCNSGHHFDEYDSKVLVAVCQFGKWSRKLPVRCLPDGCNLKIHEGSKYFLNGTLIENEVFPHSSNVSLQCLDNFDTFDENDNIVNATIKYPHMTCFQGNWKNILKCKQRCDAYNLTNGQIIGKESNITADKAVVHGYSIFVRCGGSQHKDFQMKCDNGKWEGSVDCGDERKKSNVDDDEENSTPDMGGTTVITNTTAHTNDCLLHSDERFTYRDENNIEISEGSFIRNGTTLTVGCATFDYDNYDNNLTESTVTCFDGELSRVELDCPEVDPASCMKLENGVVKKSLNLYIVSCDKGFSLTFTLPEMSEYTCQNGELRSTLGKQVPECLPKKCILPDEIDDKLSVKDKSRMMGLSAGYSVVSGDLVYFNCSKVVESIYEPFDRRFKCWKGIWIEDDEKDPNWVLGNNGTFPKCRKAICEPHCKNGGVCYKDDNCRCKHLTEGKHCETVLCDEQCITNGGTCKTGKCTCPYGRYGPNCEKKFCTLTKNSAKPKVQKILYNIGDTLKDFECGFGHILSSKDGMTCKEDGTWSNNIQCVKSVVYLISVKTSNDGWKFWKGSGTNANVYIYLHGQHGKTNKINLIGDFENNDLDETGVEEKDIRPITYVTIGHDGEGFKPNWLLEFVSIYVDSLNEIYVFRFDNPVWIEESKDVDIPLKDNCVSTFDKGHKWYPKWDDLLQKEFIGKYSAEQACQQKCSELTDFQCISVHYLRNHKTCWGFSTANEEFFQTNRQENNSVVFIRTCRQIV